MLNPRDLRIAKRGAAVWFICPPQTRPTRLQVGMKANSTSVPCCCCPPPPPPGRRRRRPATCVPGTRPAPRFKPGRAASNGRPLTRPARRRCPLRPVVRCVSATRAGKCHAEPVHAAPHTPPCHLPGRPTHAPGPFAVVRLPRPRLPRAPALACRDCRRKRQGRCAFFQRTPPRTAGAPVHHPLPSPPARTAPCVCMRRLRRACVRGRGRGVGVAWQRVAGRGRAWCGGCSLFLASRRARDHPPPSPPTHPPCIVRVHAAAASCVFARACSCGACAVRCSAVRCGRCGLAGAVRCGAVRCGAVWCGRAGGRVSSYAWWCGVRRSGVRCGAVRCGVVWWVCGRRRVPFCFLFPCGSEPGRVEQARGAVRARRAGARR